MSATPSFLPRAAPASSVIFLAMPAHVERVGVADDRDHEPLLVQVDRDAQVDVRVQRHRLRRDVDRRVHRRERPQCVDHGSGDEGQVGQRRAGLLLEPVLVLRPHLLDVVEVDLDGGPHGRRLRQRGHHPLGDDQPHPRQRDDLVARVAAGRRRCGRRGAGGGRAGAAAAGRGRGGRRRGRGTLPPPRSHAARPRAGCGRRCRCRRWSRRPAPASAASRRTSGESMRPACGRRCAGAQPLRCRSARRRLAGVVAAVAGAGDAVPPPAGSGRRAPGLADPRERRADRHGFSCLHEDLDEHAVVGTGDLGVDLVRRHLEQRVVERDRVADLLEPAADRALGDRLAQLGHRDVVHDARSARRGRATSSDGPSEPPICGAAGSPSAGPPAAATRVRGATGIRFSTDRRPAGRDAHQRRADRHGLARGRP